MALARLDHRVRQRTQGLRSHDARDAGRRRARDHRSPSLHLRLDTWSETGSVPIKIPGSEITVEHGASPISGNYPKVLPLPRSQDGPDRPERILSLHGNSSSAMTSCIDRLPGELEHPRERYDSCLRLTNPASAKSTTDKPALHETHRVSRLETKRTAMKRSLSRVSFRHRYPRRSRRQIRTSRLTPEIICFNPSMRPFVQSRLAAHKLLEQIAKGSKRSFPKPR